MAKNNIFTIPKSQLASYRDLVKRANRNVKSNLDYINEHDISSERATRSLVKSFNDPVKWASRTQPFSRSAKGRYVWDADKDEMTFREFTSKREFEAYKRELQRFGGKTKRSRTFERSPANQLKAYKEALLDSLHSIADQYSIPIDVNQSNKLKKLVNNLTLDEVARFYDHFDIEDEAGKKSFESGDDYADATDEEDFINITANIINVNRVMVETRKPEKKKRRKKKKRSKKTKKKRI